jgi:O-succinylhomoserine sulfhydrylase
VLSFEVEGGQQAAWNVVDSTSLLSITANLGDAKSTITHPTTTTHHRLTDEQRAEAGISDGLIRLSIGFEDVGDLTRDLAAGLSD